MTGHIAYRPAHAYLSACHINNPLSPPSRTSSPTPKSPIQSQSHRSRILSPAMARMIWAPIWQDRAYCITCTSRITRVSFLRVNRRRWRQWDRGRTKGLRSEPLEPSVQCLNAMRIWVSIWWHEVWAEWRSYWTRAIILYSICCDIWMPAESHDNWQCISAIPISIPLTLIAYDVSLVFFCHQASGLAPFRASVIWNVTYAPLLWILQQDWFWILCSEQ